ELAHIVLGHIGQPNGTTKDDEKKADMWARDILIPNDDFERFKNGNDYSEKSVLQFAQKQGIAPGIVVGRMQVEGIIRFNMLNNLKEKYVMA
ncbi:MAG: XRE family transcriptional regulator, partial [Ligilactobacillus ruminis]|nr:XRE family transcriptional regulator [Ligilactobacillus ruminis]